LLRLKTIGHRAGPVWPGERKSGLSPLLSSRISPTGHNPSRATAPAVCHALACMARSNRATAISPQIQPVAQAFSSSRVARALRR